MLAHIVAEHARPSVADTVVGLLSIVQLLSSDKRLDRPGPTSSNRPIVEHAACLLLITATSQCGASA